MDGEKVAAKVITEPHDYVGFAFGHPVGPGAATLHVTYQGEISRKDQQGIFQMKDGGPVVRLLAVRSRSGRAGPSLVSTSRGTRCRGK